MFSVKLTANFIFIKCRFPKIFKQPSNYFFTSKNNKKIFFNFFYITYFRRLSQMYLSNFLSLDVRKLKQLFIRPFLDRSLYNNGFNQPGLLAFFSKNTKKQRQFIKISLIFLLLKLYNKLKNKIHSKFILYPTTFYCIQFYPLTFLITLHFIFVRFLLFVLFQRFIYFFKLLNS